MAVVVRDGCLVALSLLKHEGVLLVKLAALDVVTSGRRCEGLARHNCVDAASGLVRLSLALLQLLELSLSTLVAGRGFDVWGRFHRSNPRSSSIFSGIFLCLTRKGALLHGGLICNDKSGQYWETILGMLK